MGANYILYHHFFNKGNLFGYERSYNCLSKEG